MFVWIKQHLNWLMALIISFLVVVLIYEVVLRNGRTLPLINAVGSSSTLSLGGASRNIIAAEGGAICAEPAPDTLATVAMQIASSVTISDLSSTDESSAQSADGTSRNGGSLSVVSDPRFNELFDRTQGIQAIRDGMFRLCEAKMNGGISNNFYEEQMSDLIVTLNFLIPMELCLNAASALPKQSTTENPARDATATNENTSSTSLAAAFLSTCMQEARTFNNAFATNANQRLQQRREAAFLLSREELRLRLFIAEAAEDSTDSNSVPD